MRSFVVIVAASAANFGIGKNGHLPWRLPGDMAEFKRITSTTQQPGKQNAVIMGRKTWQVSACLLSMCSCIFRLVRKWTRVLTRGEMFVAVH